MNDEKLTATKSLRQLLDERGVEWGEALTDLSRQTHWSTERYWCAFTEWNGTVGIADTLTIYHVSPEQAIAATLGRGTCELEQHGSLADQPSMVCWSCSECGFGWHHSIYDKQFSYCPNCGRRVES